MRTLWAISTDINRLKGLLSPKFAERITVMSMNYGKGIVYERVPYADQLFERSKADAEADEDHVRDRTEV